MLCLPTIWVFPKIHLSHTLTSGSRFGDFSAIQGFRAFRASLWLAEDENEKNQPGFGNGGCFCLNEQVVGYCGNLMLLEHLFPELWKTLCSWHQLSSQTPILWIIQVHLLQLNSGSWQNCGPPNWLGAEVPCNLGQTIGFFELKVDGVWTPSNFGLVDVLLLGEDYSTTKLGEWWTSERSSGVSTHPFFAGTCRVFSRGLFILTIRLNMAEHGWAINRVSIWWLCNLGI